MQLSKTTASIFCLGIAAACQLLAQTPAQPGTDVLILTNGEKLIGHLEHATDTAVVFKSDTAGEVTVKWSAVQELQSSEKFAAVPKGVKLRQKEDTTGVAQGSISATGQNVQIQTAQQRKSTPTADIGNLVDEASFQHAFEHVSLWQDGKAVRRQVSRSPKPPRRAVTSPPEST